MSRYSDEYGILVSGLQMVTVFHYKQKKIVFKAPSQVNGMLLSSGKTEIIPKLRKMIRCSCCNTREI